MVLFIVGQGLLYVHDAVAQRVYEPTLPQVPDGIVDEEEESVKIVSLVKTKEPLVSRYLQPPPSAPHVLQRGTLKFKRSKLAAAIMSCCQMGTKSKSLDVTT